LIKPGGTAKLTSVLRQLMTGLQGDGLEALSEAYGVRRFRGPVGFLGGGTFPDIAARGGQERWETTRASGEEWEQRGEKKAAAPLALTTYGAENILTIRKKNLQFRLVSGPWFFLSLVGVPGSGVPEVSVAGGELKGLGVLGPERAGYVESFDLAAWRGGAAFSEAPSALVRLGDI